MRWPDFEEVISWAADTPDNRVAEDDMVIGEGAFSGLQERLQKLWEKHLDEVNDLKRQLKEAKGFAERVSACVDEGEDLTLFGIDYMPLAKVEGEWMRLPKDAEGVPIHVEDAVEWTDGGGVIVVAGVGGNTLYYFDDVTHEVEWTTAHNKRHRRQTVEDVLCEFFSRYVTSKPKEEDDAILAEYAGKLRLREDA